MEGFADPGDRYRPHMGPSSLRIAGAREAVRDPSTSFALLTSVRMTMTVHESKNSQPLGMTRKENQARNPAVKRARGAIDGAEIGENVRLSRIGKL